MTQRACAVPECGRRHYGHGYCRPHHARWLRHGDPSAAVPIARTVTNEAVLSLSGTHRRVRAVRGRAAGKRCAGCGGEAAVWRYDDGADPAECVDPQGRRYSLDPDWYRPSCRFCLQQAAADRHAVSPGLRRRPMLDVERAARLYASGVTSRGLAALMGVSRDAVLRALRAHGVTIRPPVARPRPSRRRPVTPAASQNRKPLSNERTNDIRHPFLISTTTSTQPSRNPFTPTITTTRTSTPDQHQRQHTEPNSQGGPTHQRSLGAGRVPCGPAAGHDEDPREAE